MFFHSWKETRSFSLLLETRLNGIENKCKERNIYISIYREEQLDELARITQLRALIELRDPQLESNDGFHSLPSRRRLAKLNEIAIWKLIAGCSDSRVSTFPVELQIYTGFFFVLAGRPTLPPRNLSFELGRNLNL